MPHSRRCRTCRTWPSSTPRLPPDHARTAYLYGHPVPALHQAPDPPLRLPRDLPPRYVSYAAASCSDGAAATGESYGPTSATAARSQPSIAAAASTPRWVSRRSRACSIGTRPATWIRRSSLADGDGGAHPAQMNTMLNKHPGCTVCPACRRHARGARSPRARPAAGGRRLPGCSATGSKKYIGAYALRWAASHAVFHDRRDRRELPRRAGVLAFRPRVHGPRSSASAATRSSKGGRVRSRPRGSRSKAWVVPTNEEKTIARDVARVLGGVMPTFEPPEVLS